MIKVEANYATDFYYLSLLQRYDHLKSNLAMLPCMVNICTTKKDNKILFNNCLPLLSQINITKPILYLFAVVGGHTF